MFRLLLPAQTRARLTTCATRTVSSKATTSEFDNLPPYAFPANQTRNSTTGSLDGKGAYDKIAFIGAGKMAQAIIQPLIKKGLQPAEKIAIYDANNATMKQMGQTFEGIITAQSKADAINDADLVVCAVKPQNITEAFFNEMKSAPNLRRDDGVFLSIAAGVPMHRFIDSGYNRIVRSMPNTPATIGRGVTVWTCTNNLTANEKDRVQSVLSCFGKSMYVDNENQVDMSTSISGSGPAYIFMLMEAMIDAGVHMGFPRDKAATLVYHTLLGSTLYAMETGEHPAILRNNVTSPNGTTASALYELENGKFRTVIKDAMWACYRRSLEMGDHDSNVGPGRHQTPIAFHPDEATKEYAMSLLEDTLEEMRENHENQGKGSTKVA